MHSSTDSKSMTLYANGDIMVRRKLNEFPKPYSVVTPYEHKNDFSSVVKHICRSLSPYASVKSANNRTNNCKVIILGDVCVGKSSLVRRFCHEQFQSNYKGTVGVDFEVQRFEILNVPFNLHIWDTAGQERFKSIAQSYYRSAQVIILVFDLSNLMTLTNTKKWLDDALKWIQTAQCYIFLVGTKKDLLVDDAYKSIEKYAMNIASDLPAEFWGVSARTGENVAKLFSRIAAIVFNDIIENSKMEPNGLSNRNGKYKTMRFAVNDEKIDKLSKQRRPCCSR